MNRFPDTEIGCAAADIACHSVIDLGIGGGAVGCEESGGGHDLAGLTVAALRNLLFNPCLLHGMESISAETFDGHNFVPYGALDGRLTGARRFSVQMNRTGAANGNAAAVFGSSQLQQVTQDPKQGHIRFRIDCARTAVDFKGELGHRRPPAQDAQEATSRRSDLQRTPGILQERIAPEK
jgi:hypothetical protein